MLLKFENHLPLGALDIVSTGQTGAWGSVTFTAEARSVKLTDAVAAPGEPNAWCYIRSGSPQERAATLENYLGPVLNVERGKPLKTVWINKLPSMDAEKQGEARSLAAPPINPLPMDLYKDIPQFDSMNYPLGVVTHLHGGKVLPTSDGWPLHPASFESNPFGMPSHRTYLYPNDQRAAMLWFHDHGMDNTAQQVHAGLAGLYFVRDESDADIFHLIGSETQELPLVIQDRCLEADGAHVNYRKGVPIETDAATGKQKFTRPEFLGDTVFVNGRPWPHVHVSPKVYRLRLLNGSNARTYALTLADPEGKVGGKNWYGDLITAIGNDGGLFGRAEKLDATHCLLLAPGERLDILIDLTQLDPAALPSLNFVNLALGGIDPAGKKPEQIFQTDDKSVLSPTDAKTIDAIRFTQKADGPHANQPLANVLQFRIVPAGHAHGAADPGMPAMAGPAPALNQETLNKILRRHADDESFHWDAATPALVSNPASAPIARNRFVLLMNDTAGKGDQNDPPTSPYTGGPWRDTQIWELRPSTAPADASTFVVPFDAKLSDPTQRGAAAAGVPYQVARAFFFEPEDPKPPHPRRHKDRLWSLATENVNPAGYPPVFRYAHLYRHAPGQGRKVFHPTEGTYERWYVANIGNDPGDLASGGPDMHPFHMHLVNFVVTARYKLEKDAAGKSVFKPIRRRLDFDGIVRHDTVRIQSNELVELLVHFPKGYTGRYPYHCHLVEHEDMGMMLHFEVQPRPGA